MDKQTEKLIENISSYAYANGAIDKMLFISIELMKIAEKHFSKGEDALANAFRSESIRLKESYNISMNARDSNKKVIDDSWSILDNCIGDIIYPE